jgi:hypothetical protein
MTSKVGFGSIMTPFEWRMKESSDVVDWCQMVIAFV